MGITCGGNISLSVDLRSQISDIRDQGARPLCMICAASDVHEAFHATGFALSAEYLTYYCQKHDCVNDFLAGFGVNTVSSVLTSNGQPSETFHPYVKKELTSAVRPPVLGSEPVFFGKLVDDTLDIVSLIECLDNTGVVLIGMKVTKDFLDVTSSDFIVSDTKGFFGLHAMVVIGYGDYNNKRVFLVRNSWGIDWGYQGHAWVSDDYLTKHCMMMARVESI